LELAKPIDEGSWSAGYKFGVYLGPDSDAFGSGFADNVGLSEAYIDLRAPVGNGLDIRAGYFPTIIGFEVYDSPSNPNFSRSYGYAMEPFNHTGVLLSYQINDMIGVSAGVANDGAQSNVIGFRDGHDSTLSYMASVSLTAPEGTGFLEGSTLTAGVIDTGIDGGPGTGNPSNPINYYIGGTLPTPVEGLSLGLAFDYQTDALAGATPATFGKTDDQWAVAGYVTYMASDKLSLNGRVDYAQAEKGFGGVLGTGGQSGELKNGVLKLENEDLLSFTLTADYQLWDNVLSRLEFRYDMADGDVFGGKEGAGVFGTGDTNDAATLALNLVYQF
jgi:hypothetical protein